MEISSCVELVLITIPLWNLIQVRENTSTDTVIKCFAYVTALSHTACCKELGYRSPKCNRRCSNVAGVFQGPKGITLFHFVLSRPSFFMLLFLFITVPWNQRCSSISSSAISDPQMWLVYIFKGQKALLCPSLYCQGRHSLCYYFFVLQFLRTDSTLKFTVKIQILILLYNLRRL